MDWPIFTLPQNLPTQLQNIKELQLGLEFSKKIIDLFFNIVPQLLWALSIVILTRFAIKIIGGITRRALKNAQPTLRKFIVQAVEIFILVVGVVATLNALGIQATSIVAVIGAAGLAISLSWQNTLSHFAAGMMLISLRPFQVGDFIEGGNSAGLVDEIGIFSTTIITPDNVKITIPNGQLFNGTIKNTTALGTRRVDLEIPIGSRQIAETMTLLLEVANSHPLVLDHPAPTCLVASLTKDGTSLYLRPWCASVVYEQVRSQIQQQVKEALENVLDY